MTELIRQLHRLLSSPLQIEGVDPDNARVVVKLAIGGKTVTISQHSLRLVTRKEYDKYSKDLSTSEPVTFSSSRQLLSVSDTLTGARTPQVVLYVSVPFCHDDYSGSGAKGTGVN